MLKHSTRRWLAGLGVAGAFVAASATPAAAEEATDGLFLYANNALVAPGGEAKSITLYAFTELLPEKLTVTIDRSEVDGFANVVLTDRMPGCKENEAVITCTLNGADTIDYLVDLTVTAGDSATPGDKGELAMSVAVEGQPTATTRATVEVGEGVDLKAESSLDLAGEPGATVQAPLRVANVGDTTARDAVLFMAMTPALAPAERHANCSYVSAFGANFAQCRFDEEIAVDAVLQLDGSLKVAPDTWAPSRQFGQAVWFASGDWEEFAAGMPIPEGDWKKGDGSPLKLVPAPAARAQALKQTDQNSSNNITDIDVDVTGDQRADLAATGAELVSAAGTTVSAKVGYVNNGPAMVNTFGPGELLTAAEVTIPAGATVVAAPKECSPGDADGPTGSYGEPGARVYFCQSFDLLRKGDSAIFEFGLRIDQVGGAPGAVKLLHFDLQEAGQVADLDPKNDTAALLIKGAADGDGGQGGGEDGDGGSLPITGDSTGLIAGIGGLLLAAGVGGFVVARRRRTRFVA